ncbi:MAG: hypothetical protein AAF447_14120 [Myxococcota bacterium]
MILPPRRIPRLAGVALVLGAGGCGDEGPPTPASVAETSCAALARCAFDSFGDYYDEDLERCIEVRTNRYEREAGERDADCADAFLYLRGCEEAFLLSECSTTMARERCADLRASYDAACE